jgi:thioesterase domain-containing protein/acyl carrier protein
MRSTDTTNSIHGLIAIVEKVLNLPSQVNESSNFFQLGGSSLQAIALAANIVKEFNVTITAVDVVKKPEIKQLFKYIVSQQNQHDNKKSTSSHSTYVPINHNNGSGAIVLFHPVGGDILCYNSIFQIYKDRYHVAGIRSYSLDTDYVTTDLTELTKHYVKDIMVQMPTQPLYFGGWSLGGVIAYEAASQLEKAGREVNGVFLIDSWLGTNKEEDFLTNDQMVTHFFIDLVGDNSIKEILSFAQDSNTNAQIIKSITQLCNAQFLSNDINYKRYLKLFDVYKNNMKSLEKYDLPKYEGDCIIFNATNQSRDSFPNLFPFFEHKSISKDKYLQFAMSEDHMSIMNQDSLNYITKILSTYYLNN